MDPWKRYRLLACIVVMLTILGAGVWGRVIWGVPDEPYGSLYEPIENPEDGTLRIVGFGRPRSNNPFDQLQVQYDEAAIEKRSAVRRFLGKQKPAWFGQAP